MAGLALWEAHLQPNPGRLLLSASQPPVTSPLRSYRALLRSPPSWQLLGLEIAPDTLPRPPEPVIVATARNKMSKIASNLRDKLALINGMEGCQISLSDISIFAAEEAARQGLSQKTIDNLFEVIRNGEATE